MATIRRAGFGSVFEVENETVGIGTTGTATNTLQVLGDIKSSDATVIGLSTLTTYQGFVDKEARFGKALIDVESQAGTIGEIVIEGDVTVSSASTLTSSVNQLTLTDSFSVPTGNTDSRIHCHTAGSMRFNEDLGTLEFYTGDMWKTVNSFVGSASRGYIAGGFDGSAAIKSIDLINIPSLCRAVDFGGTSGPNMKSNAGRASSRIQGFSFGGNSDATIFYFTMSTQGAATDFGESDYTDSATAVASSTRAISQQSSTSTKALDYIEMATKADALDFADLTEGRSESGSVSSSTRGLFCGGGAPSGTGPKSIMDFFTIASKGNAATFGDLTNTRGQMGGGVSDGVRGVVAGGYGSPLHKKGIDYMTIASTGNAIRFGDLMIPRAEQAGATCNRVRGLFCGGATPSSPNRTNSMEFVTIASQGNGQDFGDLSRVSDRIGGGCISDSHGGLGGF